MPTKKHISLSEYLQRHLGAWLIGLFTFILLYGMIAAGLLTVRYDIKVGQPSPKTIYATKDVEDTVTTESLREAAAKQVEPSYKNMDSTVISSVLEDTQNMFNDIWKTRNEFSEAESVTPEILEAFNSKSPITVTGAGLTSLLSTEETDFNAIVNAVIQLERETLNSTLPEGQESAAISRISRTLLNNGYPSALVTMSIEVLRQCLRPNMLIDTEITEANRQKARDTIEPEIVVKREVIVRQGELITKAQYQMIASLGLLADNTMDFSLYGGLFLLVLVLCSSIGLFLRRFDQRILLDSKRLLLVCIIILLEIGCSLLARSFNSLLMPVALGAFLLCMLVDSRTSIFVNSALAVMVSLLVSSEELFSMTMFDIILMSLVSGPIVVNMLKKKLGRARELLCGLILGAANMAVTLSVGMITSANLSTVFNTSLWAGGSGLLSAVLALLFQAILEYTMNLPTGTRLLELCNPSNKLMRRLLLEAPGTYHHSIIVANLAEAAADAIGANGLLARVGAYYHDVGKLRRPTYFKENQIGDNPHDRTDPRISAAILTAHPNDGVELAGRAHLPQAVAEIIQQHHGDSVTTYFYQKAKELYGDNIDITQFRYAGPRPRSREAAVVMLADTIEAAVRSMPEPTMAKIESLIRKLFQDKLKDGQLNESELEFGDLERICGVFCTVLSGIFHERIEYPDVELPTRGLFQKTTPPAVLEAAKNSNTGNEAGK